MKKAKIVFFLLSFILGGCDFSPPFNKKILEAQKLISDQNYVEAIVKYKEVLERNPSLEAKVKILYQLGELYSLYLNQPKEGIKYFYQVINETDEPLWLVKSEEKIAEISFTYLRDFQKSFKSYENLADVRPALEKRDFYEFQMALSLLKSNKFKEAISILEKISVSPQHKYSTEAYFYSALGYFHLKNWELAEKYLKVFIRRGKRRDKIVEAKYLLANIYETNEKLKIAYDLYYSILGEYPNTRVLKNRLESIYQRKIVRKR